MKKEHLELKILETKKDLLFKIKGLKKYSNNQRYKVSSYFQSTSKLELLKDFNKIMFKPKVLVGLLSISLLLTGMSVKNELSDFKEAQAVEITERENLVRIEEEKQKQVIKESIERENQESLNSLMKEQRLKEKKEKEIQEKKEALERKKVPVFNNHFIDKLAKSAVQVGHENDIYPSVIVAQAIIESGWGTSGLSANYNNYFGIKAVHGQQSVTMETREVINGQDVIMYEPFAVYTDIFDSLQANADVFNGMPEYYSGVFRSNTSSYQDATQWLTKRYATDENYNTILNECIETNQLWKLDNVEK